MRPELTPREVVEQLFQAWADKAPSKVSDLFAEDGVLEFPFPPEGHPSRIEGRDALRERDRAIAAFLAEPNAWAEYRSITWHETADPEVLIVECESHGDTAVTGPFVRPYIYVFRIRDGEIVHLRDYGNPNMASEVIRDVSAASQSQS